MKHVPLPTPLPLFYQGPDLTAGPLPALFYFALSARESLEQDPYNQLVQYMDRFPVRIFSCDLPHHGESVKAKEALTYWAKDWREGHDFLSPFLEKIASIPSLLLENKWTLPGKIGAAGLSRGAFIACHLAARCPEVSVILGFAPLTSLSSGKNDFPDLPICHPFDLDRLAPQLYDRKIRFYIGNMDMRVGTKHAFSFIQTVAKEAAHRKIRSSPIELIIGPSFGHQGHGTSRERFQSGAAYLKGALS